MISLGPAGPLDEPSYDTQYTSVARHQKGRVSKCGLQHAAFAIGKVIV